MEKITQKILVVLKGYNSNNVSKNRYKLWKDNV